MKLTRLSIRNFRSLYDVDLELKPLTILIGPNASGKSNLFKALRFLYDGVAGDIRDWQAYDAQIDELLWYGYNELGERPDKIKFFSSFTLDDHRPRITNYQLELLCRDVITVSSEKLALIKRNDEDMIVFFDRHGETIGREYDTRGPLPSPLDERTRSSRTPTLRDDGPNFKISEPKAVYEHLSGWRFFDINLTRARRETFVPEYPEIVSPLKDDASNLSAFLYAVWRLQPDDFAAINEALTDFIDLPQEILTQHDADRGGKNARYQFVEEPFGESHPVPPESMSDGTISLLAHLALLLGDRTVSLACLEEPDFGLHPRLMLYLADVLRQVVAPALDENEAPIPPSQVIITTHSPEFMDCFDLEAEQDYLQVYVTDRDEFGRTVFTPATAEEFAPWLEKYRLGEAVRRRFV